MKPRRLIEVEIREPARDDLQTRLDQAEGQISRVSRQRLSSRGAPLPSRGSR